MINRGINLLTDNKKDKPISSKNRIKILRIGAISILFGVGFLSIAISILIIFSPLPQLRKEEQQAKKAFSEFILDINKLYFINDRGDGIQQLLKTRSNYDKKIEIVKSKMPADVDLVGLTIVKRRYTLKFTGHNLVSLDELLNALVTSTGKGRDFIRVYLTTLSLDQDRHNFMMVVDLLTV